jgi:hypothetical protein
MMRFIGAAVVPVVKETDRSASDDAVSVESQAVTGRSSAIKKIVRGRRNSVYRGLLFDTYMMVSVEIRRNGTLPPSG